MLPAVDLAAETIKWQVRPGEHPQLIVKSIPVTGTENIGGRIVTGNGLILIAPARDDKFRAYDKTTGQVPWDFQLPAGGHAPPSIDSAGGTQYLAIAAVGGKFEIRPGDGHFAFALPSEGRSEYAAVANRTS